MPRKKGSKDLKPRVRKSNNTVIIERKLKCSAVEISILKNEIDIPNMRKQILRQIGKSKKPFRFRGYIPSEVTKMINDNLIIRIGSFFQLTNKGFKCLE